MKYSQLEKEEWTSYKHLRKHSINPLINYFNWKRHIQAYNFIGSVEKNVKILDIGCYDAAFTRILTCKSNSVIGLEIEESALAKARSHCEEYLHDGRLHLIQARLEYLPFKEESFDVVVLTSVLEHIFDLDMPLAEIKKVLKRDGLIIVGYPIETIFMKALVRILWPESRHFDTWYSPKKMSYEEWLKLPLSHKNDYKNIRKALLKHFLVFRKIKLPFHWLPDLFSYYELYKLGK